MTPQRPQKYDIILILLAVIILSVGFLTMEPSFGPTGFAVDGDNYGALHHDNDDDQEGGCECDGGIKILELQTALPYTGGAVSVEARAAKKDKLDTDPYGIDNETFNGILFNTTTYSDAVAISKIQSNGTHAIINFIVDVTKIAMAKMDSNADFRVTVNNYKNEVRIHTSCSQPIGPPFVFGNFTVLSFIDKQNNLCNGRHPAQIGAVVCELDIDRSASKIESLHIETTNTDPDLNSLWLLLWNVTPGTTADLILQEDTELTWAQGVVDVSGSIKAALTQEGSFKKLKLDKDHSNTLFISGTGGVNPQLDAGGWHRVEIKDMDNVIVTFDNNTITGYLSLLKVKLKPDSSSIKDFKVEIIGNTSAPLDNDFTLSDVQVDVPETRITAFKDKEYEEKAKNQPSATNGHTEAESKSSSPSLGDAGDLDDGNNNNLTERDGACIIGSISDRPGISILKLDNPDPVFNGSFLNYTLSISNTGSSAAFNITVQDLLPPEVTFVSASPLNTSATGWIISTLENDTATTINITVLVNSNVPNGTIITNFANLTFYNGTSNKTLTTTENTLVFTNITLVQPLPEISIAKNDNPDPVFNGSFLNYTLSISNTGSSAAFNITVQDILPPEVTFVSASPPNTSATGWIISTLENDTATTINITVLVNSNITHGSIITNFAEAVYNNMTSNVTINTTETTLVLATLAGLNQTVCCCTVSVSTTPEVVSQGEKVLVAADVINIFTGNPSTPSDLDNITTTIYYVENNTQAVIVNNASMTFLTDGLWYYQFDVGKNKTGTYVAVVDIFTNQTPSFHREGSDTFTIGERAKGLTIRGISPDLININETVTLAAEITANGIPIDKTLLTDYNLAVTKVNGTTQIYDNNSIQIDDGLIFLNGNFNESGVYFLDWNVTHLGESRSAREVVVVVKWQPLLEEINSTVNGELITLIKDTQQRLLDLLTNMEYLQEFTEEEIFLITDSVNSMSEIVGYLEGGEISEQAAEEQFNKIKERLSRQLGIKITGSVVGTEPDKPIFGKLSQNLKDWRFIMFAVLLLMFTVMLSVLLLLIRGMQTGVFYGKVPQKKTPMPKIQISKIEKPKRRYEILLEKFRPGYPRKPINKVNSTVEKSPEAQRRYEILLEKFRPKSRVIKKTQNTVEISPEALNQRRYSILLNKIKNKLHKPKELPSYIPGMHAIKKKLQERRDEIAREHKRQTIILSPKKREENWIIKEQSKKQGKIQPKPPSQDKLPIRPKLPSQNKPPIIKKIKKKIKKPGKKQLSALESLIEKSEQEIKEEQ